MHEITDDALRRELTDRLRRYHELRERLGPERAREAMLEGFPEKQAARLGPALKEADLARGLARALPWLEAVGLVHEIVDDSRPGEDAALEIAFTCTCTTAAAGIGIAPERAEPLLCDLELEATRRAFPELDVRALAHRTEGKRVCVFRYRRDKKPGRQDATA